MSFRSTVNQWPSRSSIRGAAVISEDGLLIHDELDPGIDREAVAALAVAVRRHAEQLAAAAQGGALGSVVVELSRSPAVLSSLDDRHTLVVLAYPDRDLGQLLFDIRSARAVLAGVI